MANEEVEIFGYTYVTDDALGISDRNSSVGEANMRTVRAMAEDSNLRAVRVTFSIWTDWTQWAEHGYSVDRWERLLGGQGEPPDVIELHGGYGSGHIWVLVPPDDDRTEEEMDEGAEDPHENLRELVETVHALEGHPLISDDEHSEVENEWEAEAWENWLRSDLLDTLPSDFWREGIEDRDARDRILFNLYREAAEDANEYPVFEGQGVWLDVNAIKDAFFEVVVDAMTASSSRPHVVRHKDESEREWLTRVADWIRAEIEEEYDRGSPDEERLEPLQDEYARLQDEIEGLP